MYLKLKHEYNFSHKIATWGKQKNMLKFHVTAQKKKKNNNNNNNDSEIYNVYDVVALVIMQ